MIDRGQRQHFPDEVYDFVERALLGKGGKRRSAEAIHRDLVASFKDRLSDNDLPTARTIRTWIGGREAREDLWSVARSSPGEAASVLPVLSAARRSGSGRWVVTMSEARTIARIAEVAPGLPALSILDLTEQYEKKDGYLTPFLDLFLAEWVGLRVWEDGGDARFEDAIAKGELEVQFLMPGLLGEGLRRAFEEGLRRRYGAEGRST